MMEEPFFAHRRPFSAMKWEEKVRGSKLKYLHTEVAGKEMWQGVDAQPRSAGHYRLPKSLCLYAAVISTCAGNR